MGQWDPYQLRQVFVNVIANAVDASHENSEVLISTELLRPDGEGNGQVTKHYARVTIADHGKGMDKATRDRIFEPFFSTKKRGTGLGLAIVKQIVEQHGGRISVDSEPGKGSKFRIDLPFNHVYKICVQRFSRGFESLLDYFIGMRETDKRRLKLRRREINAFIQHRVKELPVALRDRTCLHCPNPTTGSLVKKLVHIEPTRLVTVFTPASCAAAANPSHSF